MKKWILPATLALAVGACAQTDEKASGEAAETPQTPEAYIAKSEQLRHEGKAKEAGDTALKAYVLAKEGPRVAEQLEMAKAFGAAGNSAGAINSIKELERQKREAGLQIDEVEIAEVYAQIGDPNAVFRWLERAITANSPNLKDLANNRDLEPVKTDPRWAQILASVPK